MDIQIEKFEFVVFSRAGHHTHFLRNALFPGTNISVDWKVGVLTPPRTAEISGLKS